MKSEIHKPISSLQEEQEEQIHLNLPDVRREDQWIYLVVGFVLGSACTVLGMLTYAFCLR